MISFRDRAPATVVLGNKQRVVMQPILGLLVEERRRDGPLVYNDGPLLRGDAPPLRHLVEVGGPGVAHVGPAGAHWAEPDDGRVRGVRGSASLRNERGGAQPDPVQVRPRAGPAAEGVRV